MKKVIKLTESDLINIVKNIITEQTTFSEIKGTTSKERISSLSVMTNAGLKADENNYKGRWVLEGIDIGKTFSSVKNLSLFKNLTPKSPQDGENYIEFTVRRFTKPVFNPDKTIKTKSTLDEATPAKVESLTNTGSKTFNTNYIDDTDNNYVWRMTKIVASNNGLLALSRALVESKVSYPNRITIGFSQEQRTSTSYEFNASVVGNISAFLNGLNLMLTAYIFKLNGISSEYVQGDIYVSNLVAKYSTVTEEEVANLITRSFYSLDKQFIPENEIENFRKKLTPDGQPLLPNYDSTPILALLKTFVKSSTLVNGTYRRSEPLVKRAGVEYDVYNNVLSDEILKQYKNRILAFFSSVYGAEQAKQLVDGTQFDNKATRDISTSIYDAIFGIKRTNAALTPAPQASERKGSNVYPLGGSIPGQARG